MAGERLEARVRKIAGVPVIDLTGEVDAEAEHTLTSAYDEASRGGEKVVLLNFSCVDYINSKGIAYIVTLLARARRDGKLLIAFGLSEHYQEIFRITRLAEYLELFPDEETAMGAALETSRS